MMTEGILQDVVPVLHFLRNLLGEVETSDENTEFESTREMLLRLETVYDGYDDLQIIKSIREKLSEYISTKSEFSANCGLSMSRKGLEPIRKMLHQDVAQAIQNLTDEDLLNTKISHSSFKPREGEGGYCVFNFDNLPDFEPLEVALEMLRHKDSITQGLDKLLLVDVDELFDHPQWSDLLQLLQAVLTKYLSDTSPEGTATVVQALMVVTRFVVFMPPGRYQCVGAMEIALRYIWTVVDIGGTLNSDTCSSTRAEPTRRAQRDDLLRSSLCRVQLGLFAHILRIICHQTVGFVLEKDISEIVTLVFLIIAHGRFRGCAGDTDRSETPKRIRLEGRGEPTDCTSGGSVSVLDMLIFCDCSDSLSDFFVDALMRHWHPVSVLTTAIHTGCVAVLFARLNFMLDSARGRWECLTSEVIETLDFLLTARIWLSLVSPFYQHNWVIHLCTSTIDESVTESGGFELLPVYWEALGDATHAHRHHLSFVPMENTNKRLNRLQCDSSSSPELWFIVKTAQLPEKLVVKQHSFPTDNFDKTASQCLQRVCIILRSACSSESLIFINGTCVRIVEQLMHVPWARAPSSILTVMRNCAGVITDSSLSPLEQRHMHYGFLNFLSGIISTLGESSSSISDLRDVVGNVISFLTTSVSLISKYRDHERLHLLVRCCISLIQKSTEAESARYTGEVELLQLLGLVLAECSAVCQMTPEVVTAEKNAEYCRFLSLAIEFLSALVNLYSPSSNLRPMTSQIALLVDMLLNYAWNNPQQFAQESIQALGVLVCAMCWDGNSFSLQVQNMSPILGETSLLANECFEGRSRQKAFWLDIVYTLGLTGMDSTVTAWLQFLLDGDCAEQSAISTCKEMSVVEALWAEHFCRYSDVTKWLLEEELSRVMAFLTLDLNYCLRARCHLRSWYQEMYPLPHSFHSDMHSATVNMSDGICPSLLLDVSLRGRMVDMFVSGDVEMCRIRFTDNIESLDVRAAEPHVFAPSRWPDTSLMDYCHQLLATDCDLEALSSYSQILRTDDIRMMYADISHSEIVRKLESAPPVGECQIDAAELLSSIYNKACGEPVLSSGILAEAISCMGSSEMGGSDYPGVVHWFSAIMSVLILDIPSSLLRMPSECNIHLNIAVVEQIELDTYRLLSHRRNKDVTDLFQRIGVPCRAMIRNIFRNWFLGWISLKDILLITLVVIIKGPNTVGDVVLAILRRVGRSFVEKLGLGDIQSSPLIALMSALPPQCSLAELLHTGKRNLE